jgi:hypothetical protein
VHTQVIGVAAAFLRDLVSMWTDVAGISTIQLRSQPCAVVCYTMPADASTTAGVWDQVVADSNVVAPRSVLFICHSVPVCSCYGPSSSCSKRLALSALQRWCLQ